MFFPLALPLTKRSTLSTVRLYADTWNPLLSMLRMRFSPITAMPITPISDFSCIAFPFCSQSYTFTCRKKTKREKCCSYHIITEIKAQQKGHEDEHEKQYCNVRIGRTRRWHGSLVAIGHQRRPQTDGPRKRWHTGAQ